MNNMKGNILSKQAMLLIITMLFPAVLWYFPYVTSLEAKQAAWLAPIPAFLIFSYILKQLNYLILKNPNLSLLQIFEKATNKFVGKSFGILLLLYGIFHFSIIIRFLSERLVSSVYPNVNCEIFIISILFILSITLKSNITIIRMNEIVVMFIIILSFLLIILLLSNISIENITPISYLDIMPVFKSSFPLLSSLGIETISILLLTHQKIIYKKDIIKYGNQVNFILFSLIILLLIGSLGVFGYYALNNIPFSFMTISKQLQVLNFIPGFESIFITIWVISEFIVLNVTFLSLFKVLEYLFNIKHNTGFVNIVLIFAFMSSKLLTKNTYLLFELGKTFIGRPIELIIGFAFPISCIWLYKIRFNKEKY